jgi:putative endonuclease
MKTGYVYIMTNYERTTFYIGVTSDLERRIADHRKGTFRGFTKRYRLKYLVYFEEVESIDLAITREKQLKNWHREWKINLIRTMNPEMRDFGDELLGIDAETSSA